jgi:four helix bundle protein
MGDNGPLMKKSFEFAVRITKLFRYLKFEKKEFVISNQVMRSGTAVGAMVREAQFAESKKDFIHKFSVALKEINESIFWLKLLVNTNHINQLMFSSLNSDAQEIVRLLVASLNTARFNNRSLT